MLLEIQMKKYEYLCCKESGSFQFDRMFKEPKEKREKSLNRITRNTKIYFAVFYARNQLKCKIIYELNSQDISIKAEQKLDDKGIIVYQSRDYHESDTC
ncbi:MAG: hypothetical protein F4218_07725 [Synechococcus sp. SB0677_bin_5]|nr:hypothetical protein [Synechococcus sp. SB0677_bin_5]